MGTTSGGAVVGSTAMFEAPCDDPASSRYPVGEPPLADGVIPVDYGFVTLNYDKAWFAKSALALPRTLEDLAQPVVGILATEVLADRCADLEFRQRVSVESLSAREVMIATSEFDLDKASYIATNRLDALH